MSEIIVVGSMNMDLMMSTRVVPNAGETVLGDNFYTDCGGKGANQAIAAAKLGAKVTMIGNVGDDTYGEIMCANLQKYQVATSGVTVCEQQSSGVAMIILSEGDNRIIVNGGANALLRPETVQKHSEIFANGSIVLAQLEIPLETVKYTFDLAKENGCATVLNPSPVCKLPKELLECTDILILNEHEAAVLTEVSVNTVEDAKCVIPRIRDWGVKEVILTLGERGCVYSEEDTVRFCPARKVQAVDTTGAGDSFCGAFLSAIAEAKPMEEAIDFATVVSSITVTRKGTSTSFPTLEEVKIMKMKEGTEYEIS